MGDLLLVVLKEDISFGTRIYFLFYGRPSLRLQWALCLLVVKKGLMMKPILFNGCPLKYTFQTNHLLFLASQTLTRLTSHFPSRFQGLNCRQNTFGSMTPQEISSEKRLQEFLAVMKPQVLSCEPF